MENEAWLCVAAASPRAAERGDGVLSGVWREEEKCGGINATAFPGHGLHKASGQIYKPRRGERGRGD